MYMPVTDPAISMDEALKLIQKQDKIIASFPEVEWAVGKVGRADSSTDPAPVNMNETIIHLKPKEEWRAGITRESLIAEMDSKLKMPGVTNIWTQPIINRIEMLATGIRSEIGVKIFGNDLETLEKLSNEVAAAVSTVDGAKDVYPEKVIGTPYIDIDINRQAAARYGIDVGMINDAIEKGIGETNLSTTIEGRERFPIRVRYAPEFRNKIENIGQIPLVMADGMTIPLSQVADIRTTNGASMIQSENGLLKGTVLLNVRGRDIGSFVAEADEIVKQKVQMPAGYYIAWSGQFENQQRAKQRLMLVIPIVLLLIFGLLYMTYNSAVEAAHVLLAVPFALTGGIYLQWLLGYNFSVAVWVGFIALFGTAVQTGVVMVIYLEEAVEKKRKKLGSFGQKRFDGSRHRRCFASSASESYDRYNGRCRTSADHVEFFDRCGSYETTRNSRFRRNGFESALHVLIITPVIFYWIHERRLGKENVSIRNEEENE